MKKSTRAFIERRLNEVDNSLWPFDLFGKKNSNDYRQGFLDAVETILYLDHGCGANLFRNDDGTYEMEV